MCCCCDKRAAHATAAILALLVSVVLIFRGIGGFISEDWKLNGLYGIPGVVLALGTAGICVTIVDGYGILQEKACFMLPFFIFMILLTIAVSVSAVVIFAIMDTQLSDYRTRSSTFIMRNVFTVCVCGYICSVVSSHMKEVKTKQILPLHVKSHNGGKSGRRDGDHSTIA